MPITKAINSKSNTKQMTSADAPVNPNQVVTATYGPVVSAAGQTIINMTIAVNVSNTSNFFLYIGGKLMTLGTANDYVFSSIQPNGTSAQITLNQTLGAGLNINAFYLGVVVPNFSLSTLTASVNSLNTVLPKNELINGNFDYWQRGVTGAISTGNTGYVADRWYGKNSLGTSGVITNSQTTGVSVGSKFGCSVQITTAPTAAQANGCELYQVIENNGTLILQNQSLSFSAKLKALGNVTAVGLSFMYATTEAKPTTVLGAEQTIAVNASTFVTGSLLNVAVSTLPTNAGVVGVRIRILGVSAGNTYDLNNGFVVEQAMVNVGASAANFARAGKNIAEELMMCQRYFEKSYDLTVNPAASNANGYVGGCCYGVDTGGDNGYSSVNFKVTKRTQGTATIYDYSGTAARYTSNNGGNTLTNGNGIGATIVGLSTITLNIVVPHSATGYVWHWAIDADI